MFAANAAQIFAFLLLLVATFDSLRASSDSCTLLFQPIRCGVPRLQPGAALPSRPSEAVRREFPWHVALYCEEGGKFAYCCGGSLITARFVLTAAHCVVNPNNGYRMTARRLKVRLGMHELDQEQDECTEELGLREIRMHDQYRSGGHKHDIALLELDRRVIFTERVLPVCLDLSEDERIDFYRLHGKIPGWGYTEYDSVSKWLRMTELPLVNYTCCLESNPEVFSHSLHDGMFCAGYTNGTVVCNGDSGGGLVSYSRNRWVLRGIVSFTALRQGEHTLCDTSGYAGFTKVRYYRDWIKGILRGDDLEEFSTSSEEEKPLFDCGKRKINKRSLIVNGARSYSGDWPWHVAVYEFLERQKNYLCGATLISDQFAITAAHCVQESDSNPRRGTIVVQLGQNDLFESSANMREVRVGKITPHTQWDSFGKANDIALLELTTNVQFNDYIQPACLPKGSDAAESNLLGTVGTIVGWGFENRMSSATTNTLQETRLSIVEPSMCVSSASQANGVICLRSIGGSNACTGDSGGGMFIEENGVWTVRGVIPKLEEENGFCNPSGFLKIASTSNSIKWIRSEMILGTGKIREKELMTLQAANYNDMGNKNSLESSDSREVTSNSSNTKSITTTTVAIIIGATVVVTVGIITLLRKAMKWSAEPGGTNQECSRDGNVFHQRSEGHPVVQIVLKSSTPTDASSSSSPSLVT
ncbi:transmembrane protease serine 9-like [Toxorhynchites rutilus septentrionalis]|uniref:transmembrane protease serine 9-like n=1 Tax=Toxorhynchites rutilus septentrionalis TaxID=329112 RepID=UPI002478CB68|nr:transmembrane protease serine 9-like [Toxorhynchites rutilus septentrionalis]